MRTAKELYDDGDCDYHCWYDYQPMVEEFGQIIVQGQNRDYQGDTWILYRKGGKYGYLCFGWGSCSGCDALQSCNTIEDVQDLMDSLYVSIKWFGSRIEALSWFNSHDWEGDYSWGDTEFRDFVAAAKSELSRVVVKLDEDLFNVD